MILEFIESVYGCSVLLKCDTCGKEFKRFKTTLKPKKTNNHFCCHKCFDKFNVGKNNASFGKEGLAREKNPRWNNGRRTYNGYYALLKKEHPFADHAGYVYEHRLVMEKIIGRYLRPEEQIHHINGNKKDNTVKNLLLFTNASEHTEHHQLLKKAS
jgi:hypothetical protein